MSKRKPQPEDDAKAWLCECGHLEPADEHEPQPLYECQECGQPFTRDNSTDGASARCLNCNKFSAKISEHGCPECGEAEMVPLVQHPEFATAE